ncbi:MAG: DUF1059 domain-containing protein [Chloroflexi bacterium HGW-Chloroflexi-10]|nr:MAG: DUF1059 domain-containing protein [Chloroflexi bacterium HGW-Chloroflexi-10]
MGIPGEGTMLYRYSCRDMGLSCSFLVTGKTQEEVDKQALEHVLEKHRGDFNNLDSAVEIEQMKMALSRSTRVMDD